MKIYPHLVSAVYGRPWAVLPETMDVIVEVLELRLRGEHFEQDEIFARLEAARERNGPRDGKKRERGVAVIPIYGTIHPKMNLMSEMSGGTSVEAIRSDLRAALADDDIDSIVFDVDSPGGSVDGIPELADEIHAARGQKPMVAVANTMMASAAYWLASQADEVIASPSAAVGSIGVIAVHEDHSGRFEKAGVKPSFITSSPYKAEGNRAEPLSKDARAYAQGQVDYFGDLFHQAIARGRGIDVATVANEYGKGRVLNVQQATDVGMVDGVKTLEQSVAHAAGLVQTTDAAVSLPMATLEVLGTEAFGDRLARVAGEVETLAAHANARREMRREDGRDLSPTTLGQLRRMAEALEPLVQAEHLQEDIQELVRPAAHVMVPHLMSRIRQLEATR